MDLHDNFKKIKILLIDDDEFIRESLGFFFEDAGIKVLALETAEEGLEQIRKDRFDVVISDYKLPGIDGIAFFRQIDLLGYTPVKFLITAYNNRDIQILALENGVRRVIPKPITSETIEAAIQEIIA